MPQQCSNLALHGNIEIKSLVKHFANYLTEEKTSIIAQWPALRTRLDDVKGSLILLGLMLSLSPLTAKCEQDFSTMKHFKSNL